jgi:hypothetical protein
MKAPAAAMLGVLVLISFVGLAIGLLISAGVRTQAAAAAALPVLLIPMVVLGGAMIRIEQMPAVVRPLTAAVPTRWGFEAAMLLEADHREREPSLMTVSDEQSPPDEESAVRCDMGNLHFPGSIRLGVLPSVLVLGVMLAALVMGIHVVLRARDVH